MALKFKQAPKLPENLDEIKLGTWYRLEPKYRPEKSFYGKASFMFSRRHAHELVAVLKSYDTEIAKCNMLGDAEKTTELSLTSARHFRAFQAQAKDFSEIMIKLAESRFGHYATVI